MRSRLLIALGFLLAPILLLADAYRFVRLSPAQGLNGEQVNCILTDSRGFTWIGTNSGLNRFDGTNFLVYNHRNSDSTSIPHDNIRSIAEDQNGMIWIGTPSGIALFNPWNGRSKLIPQSENKFPPCAKVYIDKSKTVWGISRNEIWKYDSSLGRFVLFLQSGPSGIFKSSMYSLYEDRSGKCWICAEGGLYLLDRKTRNVIFYEYKSDGKPIIINSAFEDESGNFWCASWSAGILKFNRANGNFETWKWDTVSSNKSAVNIVFSIGETTGAEGKLWAATNNGLAVWEKNKTIGESIRFLKNNSAEPESIIDNEVNALDVNSKGQVWAGTLRGISVLLPEFQIFQPYATGYSGQTSHISNDKNGSHFFSTWYGNGLQLISSDGTILRSWKQVPEGSGIESGQVSDAVRASDGKIWVASFGGLAVGDAEGNTFEQILPGNSNSICSKHITCVGIDSTNFLWAGSYGKGISKIDQQTKLAENFTSENSGLAHDLCWSILCSSNGKVWVATNNGMSRYDEQKKKFDSWTYAISGKDTIYTGVCGTIYEDEKQNIWFGSENGLFVFSADGKLKVFTRDDGLSGNSVMGIRQDAQKNFWISTTNGLTEYIPASGKFIVYSVTNGLPVSSLSGDMTNGTNGKLLIGLNSRIISFDPQKLNSFSVKPEILISSVSVAGRKIEFASNPSLEKLPDLSWNENLISFDFVSPGMRGGPGLLYSYRLKGSDENWIYSGERHFASFASLNPGNYIFECRASVANGKWTEPVAFSFTINPPFWKTWWFISISIICILAILIFIVRREATRKMREQLLKMEKQQAIEKERNRISRDMHDDLGSGLTKIAILSEVVKKKMKTPEEAGKHIDSISDSARNLVDNLNEIIWALNPENDNLNNLSAYIREYADRYLESSGIRLQCEIPETLPELHLSEEKRRFLFLVLKETLHNIVKHSKANLVTIKISEAVKEIQISINDDGQGFEISDARPLGNGLRNMKKRMETIGAKYEIHSSLGKGTETIISINFDS